MSRAPPPGIKTPLIAWNLQHDCACLGEQSIITVIGAACAGHLSVFSWPTEVHGLKVITAQVSCALTSKTPSSAANQDDNL